MNGLGNGTETPSKSMVGELDLTAEFLLLLEQNQFIEMNEALMRIQDIQFGIDSSQ